MGRHLVLVGGGHAHLTVLLNLDAYIRRGHRVTLVSPSAYHYYSGMGPGLLGGTYRPGEVRFHIRRMAEDRGGAFVPETLTGIDPERSVLRLASGEELDYDVVSFNTGSEVPLDKVGAGGAGIIPVKPVVRLLEARQSLLAELESRPLRLLVVGGGPAGVEVAGNLWRLVRQSGGRAKITLVGGNRFMSAQPEKVRRLVRDSLAARGVGVLEGVRAQTVQNGQALLTDSRSLAYDFAFIAVGIKPSSVFWESGLPTGVDGGLLVDKHLQCVSRPEIFGGGDCISFRDRPLDKVGVYAVRQNPILFHNLLAALEGKDLKPFEPQADYLLIFNLGDGRGIFRKRDWVWDGRPAFGLKNWIDRRFMKRYQVSGERDDGEGFGQIGA